MQQGETIYDVQKRFAQIVNHLSGLGKNFDIDELNIKILKSLNWTWQPKVTAITESQNIATMFMAALFGKLREHEIKLGSLNEEEDQGRKRNITFKSEIVKNKSPKEDNDSDDENLSLVIKSFNKFMKSKDKGKFMSDKKKNKGSSSKFMCYSCGEIGYVKFDCPNQSEEKKDKKFMKEKNNKVFCDSSSSSSSSDSDEEANLCLLADNESSCNKVSNSNSFSETNDYDELLYAFQELYVKYEKLYSLHRKLKSKYKTLKNKFEKSFEEEEILKNKISILKIKRLKMLNVHLAKVICLILTFLKKQLEDAINNKIFVKPMFKRKVFHKNKLTPKNKNKRTRRVWVKKGTTHSRNINCVACFYCMQKGHTFNKCRIKHFDVPNGRCAWIIK